MVFFQIEISLKAKKSEIHHPTGTQGGAGKPPDMN
jgi:hypothetical protein